MQDQHNLLNSIIDSFLAVAGTFVLIGTIVGLAMLFAAMAGPLS